MRVCAHSPASRLSPAPPPRSAHSLLSHARTRTHARAHAHVYASDCSEPFARASRAAAVIAIGMGTLDGAELSEEVPRVEGTQ